MTISQDSKHPLYWERVALGEVSGPENAEQQERLAEIASSNREILSQLPSEVVTREVLRRHRTRGADNQKAMPSTSWTLGSRRNWLAGLLAAASVAGVWALMARVASRADHGPITRQDRSSGSQGGLIHERSKGSPRLIVQQQTTEGVVNLHPGDSARPKDLLQLSYRAEGYRHGLVVSVDGRGVVTRHLPQTGNLAAPLKPEGRHFLQTSYQLDDAPDFEFFYLIASAQPFKLDAVLKTLKHQEAIQGEELPLAPPFAQFKFALRKTKGSR